MLISQAEARHLRVNSRLQRQGYIETLRCCAVSREHRPGSSRNPIVATVGAVGIGDSSKRVTGDLEARSCKAHAVAV